MKIRPLGAEWFHVDRWKERDRQDKANSHTSKFGNVPKNCHRLDIPFIALHSPTF
jgi:hypothetical protein